MFTLRKILAAAVVLCATAQADEPEFLFLPPVRQVNSALPPSLRDIESRLPLNHDLRDADFVTWAHEGTHGVDSHNSRGNVRAFYVLGGRLAKFENPRITITEVAAAVPAALRGRIFEHYLVTQKKWWEDQPLYIIHEWIAYTNGSQVRKELSWVKRGETEAHMAELGVYVSVLVDLTAKRDPEYDLGPLVTFVRWNVARGKDIAGDRWNGLPAFVAAGESVYPPALDLMDLVHKE